MGAIIFLTTWTRMKDVARGIEAAVTITC